MFEIKQKKMMLFLQPNLYPTPQSMELCKTFQKVLVLSHLLQKEGEGDRLMEYLKT